MPHRNAKHHPKRRRTLAAICLIASGAAYADPSTFFRSHNVREVTLTGPLTSLFEETEDRVELPFVLLADGIEHSVKVRIRGNSRLRVCDFLPLRLNFPETEAGQSIFAEQDKLKLVTHCRHHDRAEQDMLEEYLAYRIFNVLTDVSYRVRLLRITYVDTDGRLHEKSRQRFGFVIEPERQLADRVGATAVTLRGVPKRRQDLEHSALVFVFQYLIGNTDWGFVKADYDEGCCHNGDLYERESLVLFVPYDFDLSGLVNAKYAFPDPLLRIKKVTQRLYRGVCTDSEILRSALQTVKSHEDEILAVPNAVDGLSQKSIDKAIKYLSAFFEKAQDEDKLMRYFERICVGKGQSG